MADEARQSAPKSKRPRGRPKRADAPVIPWNDVDRVLVFGEAVKDEATGVEAISFPSFGELGSRYGVSKSLIHQYCKRANCLRRREEAQIRQRQRFDEKVIERTAEARALGAEDVVRVVDVYIDGFRTALEGGKVRLDSPSDLDRLVRLKELMLGNADARQEIQGGLTLDAVQRRHARMRGQLDGLTPELAGADAEAAHADEGTTDGSTVH